MGRFATKRDLAEAIIEGSRNPDPAPDSLTIMPRTEEAIPRSLDERIIGAAMYLKHQKITLAEEDRQELIFYDPGAIHKLLRKHPGIMNAPDFDYDNLRHLVEVEGYCTAAVEINSKTGMIDIYSRFQKSWWQRLLYRLRG